MTVYGYIRVSTDQQADAGHSLQAQTTALQDYCNDRKLSPLVLVIDAAVSASKPLWDRPEGRRLTLAPGKPHELKKGDVVIACKLDRLFRSVLDCAQTIDKWRKAGIEMHLLDLRLDTSTPTGQMVLSVLSAMGEMERGLVSERNRSIAAHLKAAGKVRGHVPYGYRREGSDLVPDPDQQSTLQQLRAWQAEGIRPAVMARRLNEAGIPGPKGPIWHRATVSVVLAGV